MCCFCSANACSCERWLQLWLLNAAMNAECLLHVERALRSLYHTDTLETAQKKQTCLNRKRKKENHPEWIAHLVVHCLGEWEVRGSSLFFILATLLIQFSCSAHSLIIGGIPQPYRDIVGKNLSTRSKTTLRNLVVAEHIRVLGKSLINLRFQITRYIRQVSLCLVSINIWGNGWKYPFFQTK